MLQSSLEYRDNLQEKPSYKETKYNHLRYIFPAKLCAAAIIALFACVILWLIPYSRDFDNYFPWFCCAGALLIQTIADRFLFDRQNVKTHTAAKILRSVF